MSVDPAILNACATQQRDRSAFHCEAAMAGRRRAVAMAEMYTSGGKTYAEIGRAYGVSTERVRQILSRIGISGIDGGWCIRRAKRRAERVAHLDERSVRRSGCSREQWRQIPKKIRSQYSHKRDSVINLYGAQDWAMTLWEYFTEVNRAGVNVARGGFGMTRIDPKRPFAPGNVEFAKVGSWIKQRSKESSSDG